jgi:hypothetical protein
MCKGVRWAAAIMASGPSIMGFEDEVEQKAA